jgi:hypothetical protein
VRNGRAPGIASAAAILIPTYCTYLLLYYFRHCYYNIAIHSPHTRDKRLIHLSVPPSRLSPPQLWIQAVAVYAGLLTTADSPRLARRTLSLLPLTHARLALHARLTACSPSESHAPTVPVGSCPTRRRRALHRRTSTSGRGKRTTAAKRPCSRNRRITAASSAPKDT